MEGFSQLGSISMINNRTKKQSCRKNYNNLFWMYALAMGVPRGKKSVNFKVTLVHVNIQTRNMTCKEHKTHKHYRMKMRTQREFQDNHHIRLINNRIQCLWTCCKNKWQENPKRSFQYEMVNAQEHCRHGANGRGLIYRQPTWWWWWWRRRRRRNQ